MTMTNRSKRTIPFALKLVICLLAVWALSMMMLSAAGCGWLESRSVPDAAERALVVVEAAVEVAEVIVAEVEAELAATTDPEDRGRLGAFLADARADLAQAKTDAKDAKAVLADMPSNAEMVLTIGGAVATVLGLPYVPLITSLVRSRGRFGQLVANVHHASAVDEGADSKIPKLSLTDLKDRNVRTGLQPFIIGPLDAAKAAEVGAARGATA